MVVQGVAGERHGDRVGFGHELGEHLPLLGGKVHKAVQVKVRAAAICAGFELLCQSGQPIPWVGRQPLGQGVIALQHQSQLPQPLPLPFRSVVASFYELLGLDAVAFQLAAGGQQMLQKGGLFGRFGVEGQLGGDGVNRLVHEQQLSAAVQHGLSQAASFGEHPMVESGEGEHFRPGGRTAPQLLTEAALRLVGVLFGDDEHLRAVLVVFPHGLVEAGGFAGLGTAE